MKHQHRARFARPPYRARSMTFENVRPVHGLVIQQPIRSLQPRLRLQQSRQRLLRGTRQAHRHVQQPSCPPLVPKNDSPRSLSMRHSDRFGILMPRLDHLSLDRAT
jgi:hypothetical protein